MTLLDPGLRTFFIQNHCLKRNKCILHICSFTQEKKIPSFFDLHSWKKNHGKSLLFKVPFLFAGSDVLASFWWCPPCSELKPLSIGYDNCFSVIYNHFLRQRNHFGDSSIISSFLRALQGRQPFSVKTDKHSVFTVRLGIT